MSLLIATLARSTSVAWPHWSWWLGVVSIAIFTTALYLRTEANHLLAILVHLLANVCGDVAAQARALEIFFMAEGVAATVVVAAGGLRAEPSRC